MTLLLSLEDLLGELRHARRRGDLGRLALISYCEVRRWARDAGQPWLAEQSARMFTDGPPPSREAFLERIDQLVVELERVRQSLPGARHDAMPGFVAPPQPGASAGAG